MPDRGPRPPAPRAAHDQATGLRRLFEPARPHWMPVLVPVARGHGRDNGRAAGFVGGLAPGLAAWLAELARAFAAGGLERTLVVDAARAQIADALGTRLRYDLQHAFSGDCAPDAARAAAGDSLWVLPAARALELACAPHGDRRRFAAGVNALAHGVERVILVLPAARAGLIETTVHQGISQGISQGCPQEAPAVWMAVGPGPDAGAAALSAVGQALADAEIGTFHLLFLAMDETAAATLFTGIAAAARRQYGATLCAGAAVPDARSMARLAAGLAGGCRPGPARAVDQLAAGARATAVETVS
jgi:hypothetical protein